LDKKNNKTKKEIDIEIRIKNDARLKRMNPVPIMLIIGYRL